VEYATVVWNPNLKKYIFAVERVQKKFTKGNFSIPSLEKRRLIFDSSMTFDILKYAILPPDDFFQLNKNVTRCLHDTKLCVPKCRLDCKKFDFAIRVIKHWNNLSPDIIESNSKKECLKKLHGPL